MSKRKVGIRESAIKRKKVTLTFLVAQLSGLLVGLESFLGQVVKLDKLGPGGPFRSEVNDEGYWFEDDPGLDPRHILICRYGKRGRDKVYLTIETELRMGVVGVVIHCPFRKKMAENKEGLESQIYEELVYLQRHNHLKLFFESKNTRYRLVEIKK